MRTHKLGTSAVPVTPLGLGLAALGRPGYINLGHQRDIGNVHHPARLEDGAHAVIETAWSVGIRYFDLARSYGRAEQFMASWLEQRRIPAENVSVGSKWGYIYTADWQTQADVHEVKDHSFENFQRQYAESAGVLGRHLKLYQIHSATLESGVLRDTKVLRGLAGLKASGVAIGLSLSGPGQAETLRAAIPITVDGVRLFDSVQATWNLLERSAGPALSEARSAGLGVIVKEALANGRLTHRNADPAFRDKLALLTQEARRLAVSVDALAIAAALAQPWRDVVLSGATTVSQLASNMEAIYARWDAQAAHNLSSLVEIPEAYWGQRKGLAWN
jgi:aryl-alcohol dehydrogenase-like predicted oxidoreductase